MRAWVVVRFSVDLAEGEDPERATDELRAAIHTAWSVAGFEGVTIRTTDRGVEA